ncbi:unnamed protein product [Musa textilis]
MHPGLYEVSVLLLLHLYVAAFICTTGASSPSLFDGNLELPRGSIPTVSLEHLDPTLPPALPTQTPHCSLVVLQQDFADTAGASANYTHPPDCPFPWTRVVLELSAAATDLQESRVAAIWIDGAEVLRTATPIPMVRGAFWRVHKDVTRYTALLRRLAGGGGVISMMLENSNAVLPASSAPTSRSITTAARSTTAGRSPCQMRLTPPSDPFTASPRTSSSPSPSPTDNMDPAFGFVLTTRQASSPPPSPSPETPTVPSLRYSCRIMARMNHGLLIH